MAGEKVTIRVLGPVAVQAGDHVRGVPGARQQALLLRLLVAAGAPVGPWQLRHDVWAGRHKSDAALRVAINRLRNELAAAGAPDVIHRASDGYLLDRRAVDVDADDCASLVLEAHSAVRDDPRRAADAATRAIDLWRGPAFGELRDEAFLLAEGERLASLRRDAVEVRLTALLALDTAGLVPEIEAAVADAPLRERLTGLLMVALYRSGRQVDALAAYRRMERALRDDLGLSPSAELRVLDHRILQHDPTLLAPDPPPSRAPDAGPDGDAEQAAIGRARSAQALARAGVVDQSLRLAASAVAQARALDDGTLAECLIVAAQTVALAGRAAEAAMALDEAIAVARRSRDGRILAMAAIARFGFGLGRDDDLVAELMEPLELLGRDAPPRIDLLCAAMHEIALRGDAPGAARLLAQAETTAAAIGDRRSHALVLAGRSILAGVRGEPDACLRTLAAEALAAAEDSGDPTLVVAALHGVVRSTMQDGDRAAFDAAAARMAEVATASLFPFAVVRVGLLDVSGRLARGELAGLEERLADVEATGAAIGVASSAGTTQTQRGMLALERGQFDVLASLTEVLAAGGAPGWSAVHALALAESGRCAEAVALATRVLCDLDAPGAVSLGTPDERDVVGMMAAEVAAITGDRGLASLARAELDDRAGRFAVLIHATLTLGPVDRLRGLAALALGDPDSAVDELRAAVALAADWPLWRARGEVALATALRTRGRCGDVDEAARLLEDVGASGLADPAADGSAWLAAQLRRAELVPAPA